MPTPTPLAYRLRVRSPKDDGDLFVATSLRATDPATPGWYNYIRQPPVGDGLQIDPLTGQVTVGAYTVEVIDEFASVAMTADGSAIPPPPPAPGQLVIGNLMLAGTWETKLEFASDAGGGCPPTGSDSCLIWQPDQGYAELWGRYNGPIGGGNGYYYRRGVMTTLDGIQPNRSYTLRALLKAVTTFEAKGVALGTSIPPLQAADVSESLVWQWVDFAGSSDGAGNLVVNLGHFDLEVGYAVILRCWALLLYDNTLPPSEGQGGGSPGGVSTGRGRLVTSYLADLDAKQRLLGLKAYLEESTDSGATWSPIFAAYVGGVRFPDALTAQITLTDTRRTDLVTRFLKASGSLIQTEFLLGSGSALGGTPAQDNPVFKVTYVDAAKGAVMLRYARGPLPPYPDAPPPYGTVPMHVQPDGTVPVDERTRIWFVVDGLALGPSDVPNYVDYMLAFGLGSPGGLARGLLVDIMDLSGNVLRQVHPLFLTPPTGDPREGSLPFLRPLQIYDATSLTGVYVGEGSIAVAWPDSQPSVGQEYKLRLYTESAIQAFSLQGHPVDLITQLWANVGITYDPAAAATVRATLGADLAVFYRFDTQGETETTLYDFVQRSLTSPWGIAWRLDSQQRRVLFLARDPLGAGATSVETVALDNLPHAETQVWELDERSIKNRVVVAWKDVRQWTEADGGDRPADGLIAVPQRPIQIDLSTSGGISRDGTPTPDSDVAGVKEFRLDLPGYVGRRQPNGTIQRVDMEQWAETVALEIFRRVGRGVPIIEIDVLRGSTVEVGQLLTATFDHLPDARTGRFPTSQRLREGGGSRLLQVVQRTITPTGPRLRCWDVGPGATTGVVPTFTLAVSGADPRHVGVATLTNASTIAALGSDARVLVQFAVGATQPSSGQTIALLDPHSATLSVSTPPADAGSTVWIRMAVTGSITGPWSAWQSLALTALNPVTGLVASAGADGTSVVLTWTLGETAFPLAVSMDGQRLAILPPGTTSYVVRGVTGSHTFAVQHVDFPPLGGASVPASVSGAPTGGVTLTAPVDPAAFAGRHDGGLVIVDGTFGLEVTATAIPSTIVFELAVETAVGSQTPGPFTEAGRQAAVQGGRTRFTSRAPNDQKRRYLRAKSVRSGASDSPYSSPVVSVDPWAVVSLPPGTPAVQISVSAAGQVSLSWSGDERTLSITYAVSTGGMPSDSAALTGTPLNGRAGTTGTLLTLAPGQALFAKVYAWTALGGSGTPSLQPWAGTATFGQATALDDLSDVQITSPAAGDALAYNGALWVNTPTLDANARVGVRKNAGGSTYKRRRVNLIEGSGVTLTVADDPTEEEVDVTIAAAGGGSSLPWWLAAHPNTPPGTSNAEDDEFESTSLAAKWTQILAGSPVVDYHTTWKSHAYARKTADGNVFKLSQSYAPAGDFSLTALCKFSPYPTSTGNPQALLYAQGGANNAVYAKFDNVNGDPTCQLMTQDNGGFTNRGAFRAFGRTHLYMHLQRVAGTWSAWFSSDGYSWALAGSFAKALTVDTIAIEIDFGNLPNGARGGWDWFRRGYLLFS